jgi:hypothetical protein
MRVAVLCAFVCVIAVSSALTPAQRAKAMLLNMNLTEKVNMVHGWDGPYVVRGCSRLLGIVGPRFFFFL